MKLVPALILLAAVLDPAVSYAQSSVNRDSYVISVGELAMSSKALSAFKKGTTLLQKGQVQASVAYFQKAIELSPAAFRSYHNLALAQYRLGQLDFSEQNFQKSIDLSNGGFAPSLFGLSMVLYQRADFRAAESTVQRGVQVAPDSGLGRYCLALVQFSLGRIAEAQRSALDALHMDPAQTDAHLLLAHIHERLRNPYAVIADVQSYLKLSPNHELQSDAMSLLARAQQNLAALALPVSFN